MVKLSKRQQEIMDFIKQEVKQKGYPPSVREIGEAVGLASSSTVHGHLERLEQKGLLRRDPTKPRAIEVINLEIGTAVGEHYPETDRSVIMAPIIGKVTAGQPITAVENIEDYFPLPASMRNEPSIFLLHVAGNSMIDAGIFDGDMVVVRQQRTAQNGDIVVAMTEDEEATVKRFFREADHIRLQPENPAMQPLRYANVTILGKVIGLYRNIH
ncbi:transcriptional repressor LexA [Fodinisporobacter ferrooxydans]|uniref:LexA repressor n=1 Tax=Fodinisporobacter ferrooxydans TaxID=2901836 RepID=A0ABY4CGV8_9BACL|nr:transcriptional repressor LexA [Alicyclobacillaceae bacterium MYW30-H2]